MLNYSGQVDHFGPKNDKLSWHWIHPTVLSKNCTAKGQICTENYLNGFSEKILWGKCIIFGPKMIGCHNFFFIFFFNFAQSKRLRGTSEFYGIFLLKNLIQGVWATLDSKMTHCHNSRFALTIFPKFCTITVARGAWK